MIEINIQIPVWSMSDKDRGRWFVNIRESTLRRAIAMGRDMQISTMGVTNTVNPSEWIANGSRREKEFMLKGKPMVMWGNYIYAKERQPVPELRTPSLSRQ